ncbi:MAG: hypothetical protein VW270_31175 [Candidatus Poseidoniales archaeon]
MTIETILTERESRIATALFEIMRPQIEKIIDNRIESAKTSDFDIHEYTGEIEDIVSDWIRYNLTLTTTVD